MKNLKKRSLAIILAALMCLAVFITGCESNNDDTSALSTNAPATNASTNASTDASTDASTNASTNASTDASTNAPAEDTAQQTQDVQTDAPGDDYSDPITPPATYKPEFTVADYKDKAYVPVNNNEPFFTKDELTTVAFEYYSEFDSLGRCGYVFSCVGKETMPTDKRGDISYKPTGWEQNTYSFVDGGALYNRCHLIAWQLTGENNNKQNLLTGTRYMNVQGMIPFEDMVASYVKETGNHVMYRVTPIFDGNNLLADGVLIEGWSVEDEGEGVCFCVFSYNVQPGVQIDYATGKNNEVPGFSEETKDTQIQADFVMNKNNKKVHLSTCGNVKSMKEENRIYFNGSVDELKAAHPTCTAAGCCKPF